MAIVALLPCLQPPVTATTLRQVSRLVLTLLVMTGRVTMLGRSRWTGKGGSDRTVQRFFAPVIPWATWLWVFFRHHGYRPGDSYLLGGDAVVATTAGTPTHGLERCFASLSGKPVPGLAVCTWSLVSPQPRHSFPRRVEQVVRPPRRKPPARPKRPPRSRPPPPSSAVQGVRRAARTLPKLRGGSRRSDPASQGGAPLC